MVLRYYPGLFAAWQGRPDGESCRVVANALARRPMADPDAGDEPDNPG